MKNIFIAVLCTVIFFSCKSDLNKPILTESKNDQESISSTSTSNKSKDVIVVVDENLTVGENIKKVVNSEDDTSDREITVKKSKCESALLEAEVIINSLLLDSDNQILWDQLDAYENDKENNECKKSHPGYLAKYDDLMEKLN